ncbi:DUF1622 domain-containing protein [Enterococcus olivae]
MHLAQYLMEYLAPFFEVIVLLLNVLSILILVWGVLLATIDLVRSETRHRSRLKTAKRMNIIKNFLGSYILLSLEILIAADIIESIIYPTFQDIVKLAALVVIRTVISHFLHEEIKDYISHGALKDK